MGQFIQTPSTIYDIGAFGLGIGLWRITFPNGKTTVMRTNTGLITCDQSGNATLDGYNRRLLTYDEAFWLGKAPCLLGQSTGLDFKQLTQTAIETSTMGIEVAK
jgi:hypothetical protein